MPTFRRILVKSVQRNPANKQANKQTNKQTNAEENIASVAEVIKIQKIKETVTMLFIYRAGSISKLRRYINHHLLRAYLPTYFRI